MKASGVIESVITIFIVIALVTSGFLGFLVMQGILDEEGVEAVTRKVGTDQTYATIGAAITAANPGDIIEVHAGTYNENIQVNKRLTLIGNGTTNTTIYGGGTGDVVVISTDDVNITGFMITNSGTAAAPNYDAGIEVNNANNARIYGNNISGNRDGIFLNSADNCVIENNICYANSVNGITLFFSYFNRLENNSCTYNNNYGIGIENCNQNRAINNTCFKNTVGLILYQADLNRIENSLLIYNLYSQIYIYGSNSNYIANNTVNSTDGEGIQMVLSESITLTNNKMDLCSIYLSGNQPADWNSHTIDTTNTANNKPVYYWAFHTDETVPAGAGQIILANCTNVRIENQLIFNTFYSIEVGYSNSITIDSNSLVVNLIGMLLYETRLSAISDNNCSSNAFDGAWLFYADKNSVHNNTFNSQLAHGIELFESNNNTFSDNTVQDNGANGFDIDESIGNTIQRNNISSNGDKGIFLNSSDVNLVINNNISQNTGHGLYLLDSNLNELYYNNIISNNIQAAKSGGANNIWDNGNGEGNYWSDYTGLDNGAGGRVVGDGIGDTQLAHLGLDNYPFIVRDGWLFPGIPILDDPGDYDSDGNYSITWNSNRGTVLYRLEEDTADTFSAPLEVYEGVGLFYNFSLKQNGTYYYRLKAFSEQFESDWSNTVDIIVDWSPNKPINFKVDVFAEGNGLNISWDKNMIDAKVYELYSNATGTWKPLADIPHPSHTYNHTGLVDGQDYFYQLRAQDSRDQYSAWTDVISGIPADSTAPEPPSGMKIKAVTYDTITLIWNASPEDDVQYYEIFLHDIINPNKNDYLGHADFGSEEFTVTNLTELTTYYFVLKAFDEVPNESDFSYVVPATTSLGPHGPEINNTQPAVSISEDIYDNISINLYSWFKDVNFDKLEFSVLGELYLTVEIDQETGTVSIKPQKNWNGEESLEFFASDGTGNVSDTVVITVSAVNDPPGPAEIVSPQDDFTPEESKPFDLIGTCPDPDLIYSDVLTYTWTSSIDGSLGTGSTLSDVSLSPGTHTITLEVTDTAGENSTTKIIVIIEEKEKATGDVMGIVVPSIIVIIIIIVLVFVALFLSRKRKREEEKKLEEDKKDDEMVQADIIQPGGELVPQATHPPAQVDIMPETTMHMDYQAQAGAEAAAPVSEEARAFMIEQPAYPGLPAATETESPSLAPFIDSINWGSAYQLITKEPDFGLEIFEKFIEKSFGWGLVISRTHPGKFKPSMILDGANKIWLSKTGEENSVSPTNLTKIAHHVKGHLNEKEKSVIILDGIEYLITNNDFKKILKFIESLHEYIVLHKAVLLIPLNPEALDKKNFELLNSEIESTLKDPLYSES